MLRQGAGADDLDVPAQPVDQLRQLVQPELAEEPSPGGDAEIVLELAALVQIVVLVHIILDELGVGMHGAQLVEGKGLALVADPFQLDQRTVGGIGIVAGALVLLGDIQELRADRQGGEDAKAAEIEPAQEFSVGEGAAAAAGEGEVDLFQDGKFGHHPAHEKIEQVDQLRHILGIFLVERIIASLIGVHQAGEIAALDQLLVHGEEIAVEIAEIVDAVEIDKELPGERLERLNVIGGVGIQHRDGGEFHGVEIAAAVEQPENGGVFRQKVIFQPVPRRLFQFARRRQRQLLLLQQQADGRRVFHVPLFRLDRTDAQPDQRQGRLGRQQQQDRRQKQGARVGEELKGPDQHRRRSGHDKGRLDKGLEEIIEIGMRVFDKFAGPLGAEQPHPRHDAQHHRAA